MLANKAELTSQLHHKQIIHNCVHANCKAAGFQSRAGTQVHTCDVTGHRALGEVDLDSALVEAALVLATRLPICSTGIK